MKETLFSKVSSFVDSSAGPGACHPWTGPLSKGKPNIWFGDRQYSPRRVLFQGFSGIILPPEQRVLDACGNQWCCNPQHLYGGSPAQHVVQLRDTSGGPDACWPFMGFRHKGYGRMQGGQRGAPMMFAHRIAYELANGPIEGHVHHDEENEKVVMHTCDNPPCCNPKHLRLGTDADNTADKVAKGRQSRGERLSIAVRAGHVRRRALVTERAGQQTSEGEKTK